MLTGLNMQSSYSNPEIKTLVSKLREIGPERGIITSVPLSLGKLSNIAYDADEIRIFAFEDLAVSYPGSGDLFASLFISIFLSGYSFFPSVKMTETLWHRIRFSAGFPV